MRVSRRGFVSSVAAGSVAPGGWGVQEEQPVAGRVFRGEQLSQIAFPLGGIGTGTVSLGGYGNLRDWEIFNRPAKNTVLPFTFAAVRLAGGGLPQPVGRVLEREWLPPFGGSHGIPRERAAGLPRFPEAVFAGSYPFAHLRFEDPDFPVEVSLEAFNPMVPHDFDASSLPVAVLTYRFRSQARALLDVCLAFSILNPVGWDSVAPLAHRRAPFFGSNVNEFRTRGQAAGIFMSSRKHRQESFRFGSLAILTGLGSVSYRLRWEHGALWDELPVWWREFTERGRMPNNDCPPSEDGFTECATLASNFALAPDEERDVTLVLAWHFPNIEDYWTGKKPYFFKQQEDPKRLLYSHYGKRWPSAWEAAVFAWDHLETLRTRTLRFRNALYGSSLPADVIDAISSQMSTVRTNTYLVLDGKVPVAFEGCGDTEGCCPFNCTHVYNYVQAPAFLYPELERAVREMDFVQNLREDGYMSFRTATPVQHGAYTRHPAADGQMGCILKLYREWQLSGDDQWLRKLWPQARKAVEFAWSYWDRDRDGVMEGEQHNTYDIRWYGPNPMVGSLYLAALRAASEMARHLGDGEWAERCHRVFEEGSRKLDQLLWNGEFYQQQLDANREQQRWQIGGGCLADQLLGQWFAEVTGLGYVLPPERVRAALKSIFRYNFRQALREVPSGQRIYALNDEAGLVVCSFPRGNRPLIPFGYSDEVWTGVEYQVASHLIFEGFLEQGLKIVRAVRKRHDGRRRNPWDEVECGHHYARAMSSWALLLAYSGFRYSAVSKELRFRPRVKASPFRCLFVTGGAWGACSQAQEDKTRSRIDLAVVEGSLEIRSFRLTAPVGVSAALVDGRPVDLKAAKGEALLSLPAPLLLRAGGACRIELRSVA